jgi:hypothetical protein
MPAHCQAEQKSSTSHLKFRVNELFWRQRRTSRPTSARRETALRGKRLPADGKSFKTKTLIMAGWGTISASCAVKLADSIPGIDRAIEVDDETGLIVDEHPSEG